MGEADAVAGGLADVRVVEQPVDRRGREGLGHELVERGRVQVGGDGDGPFLVGGVDEPVEPLGGVLRDREQADVIHHDEVRPQDSADGFADAVVGAVPADQDAELFEGEPGDLQALLDRLLTEGLEQERLTGVPDGSAAAMVNVIKPVLAPCGREEVLPEVSHVSLTHRGLADEIAHSDSDPQACRAQVRVICPALFRQRFSHLCCDPRCCPPIVDLTRGLVAQAGVQADGVVRSPM